MIIYFCKRPLSLSSIVGDEITLPRITHREQMAAAQQTLVSCHMNQCDDASALKQPSHAQPACKISRCSIPLHSNKALPS